MISRSQQIWLKAESSFSNVWHAEWMCTEALHHDTLLLRKAREHPPVPHASVKTSELLEHSITLSFRRSRMAQGPTDSGAVSLPQFTSSTKAGVR